MSSSWENSNEWYDRTVGAKGHYFHEKIILPGVLRLLGLSIHSRLLDLACGQGILSRHIPKEVHYTGIDLSPSLIRAAKSYKPSKTQQFIVGDITQTLEIGKNFTHAAVILALQNIADPLALFKNIHTHMIQKGRCILVLNHPCYRIPRQSSWHLDSVKKIQYRRIDRYLSPLKIPIQTHPSQKEHSVETFSFHFPLSAYSQWLKESGFMIELIEEWCSDKTSQGGAAAYENRSRKEFPLFLTLSLIKI